MSSQPKTQKYTIIALFFIIMIDTMGIGLVWPLFGPLFTSSTSPLFAPTTPMVWRNFLYGISMGIAQMCLFFMAPIVGDISDSYGRKKILLACLFGGGFSMIVMLLGISIKSVAVIIVGRAIFGMISSSQTTAQAAIIDLSNTHNKSARLGVISAASNIGFIFGPAIGGILIDKSIISWFNYTTPFYFAAILALLNALLLMATFKETFIVKKPQIVLSKGFRLFAAAFTNKNLRKLAIVFLCLQLAWAIYFQTDVLTLVQKYNYAGKMLGNFLSLMGTVFCITLLLLVRLLNRLIKSNSIIITSLFIAFLCSLSAIWHSELALWLELIPIAIAVGIGSNAIVTSFSNAVLPTEQGWVMGIGTAIACSSWGLGAPIAGIFMGYGFHWSFAVSAIIFLIGGIAAFSLYNKTS